jgi:rod shape-determining protein MreC
VLSIENQELKNKIAQLQEENRNLASFARENQRLQNILGISGKYENYDMVTCRIIAKDTGNWFNTFTIDKGTNDGIKTNMTVMAPQGLVGQTISSTPTSSKVMAIIDTGSSVSARLSQQRDLMVIRGDLTLKDQGLVKMNYIPVGVTVAQGDVIETSGMGGIFPEGIIIGKISKLENDKPQLMRYAIVQPQVDFRRLEEVVILRNKQ